jgi:hypothetical protein
MSKFHNRELEMEYTQLLHLLSSNPKIICHIVDKEKGTILVSLFVRPENNSTRKTDFVGIKNEEIYFKLTDQDREICSQIITSSLNGLHWKSSKGYYRSNCTEYYLRPNWKYWYSLNK